FDARHWRHRLFDKIGVEVTNDFSVFDKEHLAALAAFGQPGDAVLREFEIVIARRFVLPLPEQGVGKYALIGQNQNAPLFVLAGRSKWQNQERGNALTVRLFDLDPLWEIAGYRKARRERRGHKALRLRRDIQETRPDGDHAFQSSKYF